MTLGAWIFLSVVLVLVVLNKPFRKFFLWAAAISVVCCGLVYGYIWIVDWREHRAMTREAAFQQKKQDDCNARLNARRSSNDQMTDEFVRLANADLCRENPDITVDEAVAAAKHRQSLDLSAGLVPKVQLDPKTFQPLPPGFIPDSTARKSVRPKPIEGIVAKDAIVYGESLPGGPGGQVLGRVESGTHVRVIRLDSIYGNVQVRAPNGITGWLSSDEISY